MSISEDIAAISGDTCLLGFSRGKDSIAAWLELRKYFKRIIPFHAATFPHLSFVDRSLNYYEDFFGTKIERFMSPDWSKSLMWYWYQYVDDGEPPEAWDYNHNDIAYLLRNRYQVPQAWCAWGLNRSDSVFRRIYVDQCKGKWEKRLSFYPNYDKTKEHILEMIRTEGLSLPEDYLYSNRTLSGFFMSQYLRWIKDHYPIDYANIKEVYPLIDAMLARNFFRNQKK